MHSVNAFVERDGPYSGAPHKVLAAHGIFPELFLNAVVSNRSNRFYEFGPFVLNPAEHTLLRHGEPFPLRPKVFDTLLVLVKNSGHLVEKDELMRAVWPGQFVEEGNLNKTISMLRQALGESAEGNHFIETVPKRGYRFIAPVRERVDESSEIIFEQSGVSRTVEISEYSHDAGDDLRPARALPAAKPPASVWRSTRAVALLAVLLVAATAVFAYFALARRTKPLDKSQIKSIAVLPFKRLDTADDAERLGIGMADTLITRLSNLRQLSVRPTRDVMKYENGEDDIAAAGRALEADAVLDGSIQRVGDRLRVTVRLVHTESKSQIWAAQFDEGFTGIFAVQDAISEQVAQALSLNLSDAEQQQLKKNYTENVGAYQA